MGLADRDYARVGGPPPYRPDAGLNGPTPWSRTVNAWLIILCVAVYVIGGFLPVDGSIETGRYWIPTAHDVWEESLGNPFFSLQDRPEETTLGENLVQETIRVALPGGGTEQITVVGLPVYDAQGNEIAIAEGHPASLFHRLFHFSTKKVIGGAELWRLVGFQFLHADLFHLLFNMIALFFFGPLVERVLGGKRYLAFYLLCGISGGLLYLLLNLAGYVWVDTFSLPEIPGLLFNAPGTSLIGASAGVFGVLVGGAFLAPNVMVLVFFILPMRLATVAWMLIGISILSIFVGTQNAGGEAAHLGGAIAGFGFIRHPDRLHRFFDWLGRFDPTSRHFRSGGSMPRSKPREDQIDRILAKISRSGLQSLTPAERKALADASRRQEEQ